MAFPYLEAAIGASVSHLLAVVAGVLLLSVLDLMCFVPMLGAVLLRKVNFVHDQVSSDIPGNPHAFDSCIISLFRTLPEPSNFNLVWTSVPLDKPLVVRGVLSVASCVAKQPFELA